MHAQLTIQVAAAESDAIALPLPVRLWIALRVPPTLWLRLTLVQGAVQMDGLVVPRMWEEAAVRVDIAVAQVVPRPPPVPIISR